MESWDTRRIELEPHHPQVLRSDDEMRIVAINLPRGEELQEHQTHETALLLVADGEVEIEQDGRTETGGPGYAAHFEAGERRQVRAGADARILLVLAPWPGQGHPRRQH